MEHANPDLRLQLPRDVYYQTLHLLRAALPKPVSDSEEDLVRRDHAAIAAIACLLPANADEAGLAAQYVGASAQAMDCLRSAQLDPADRSLAMKCTAQAASMMRQARGARSLLMRVQAERRKRDADRSACDQAAWSEHCTIGLMAETLGYAPPAPMAEPSAAAPPPPADLEPPAADLAAEAEQYAIIYPHRATLIRALGGLPAKCDFDAIPASLVKAIVSGCSPNLTALNTSVSRGGT
jgi:hypothetical protein